MFRSTPGQIQLSTEISGAMEEDDEVELVAWDADVEVVGGDMEEEELLLVVIGLELELEEDEEELEGVLFTTTELEELDELEDELAVLVVVALLGRVTIYPAATITIRTTTTITTVCTREMADPVFAESMIARSPSHVI